MPIYGYNSRVLSLSDNVMYSIVVTYFLTNDNKQNDIKSRVSIPPITSGITSRL